MAALRALGQLLERGALDERTGMTRNRIWRHVGVFEVLDAQFEKITPTSVR